MQTKIFAYLWLKIEPVLSQTQLIADSSFLTLANTYK